MHISKLNSLIANIKITSEKINILLRNANWDLVWVSFIDREVHIQNQNRKRVVIDSMKTINPINSRAKLYQQPTTTEVRIFEAYVTSVFLPVNYRWLQKQLQTK